MPDTMYATPSHAAVELSCPVTPQEDVRRALQGVTSADDLPSSPLLSRDALASRDGGVLRSPPLDGVFGASSGSGDGSTDAVAHDAWSPAFASSSSSGATTHLVPMFPSASDPTLHGFVRVRNRGESEAQVTVQAYDDTDWEYEPLTLTVAAGAVAPLRFPFSNTEDFGFFG